MVIAYCGEPQKKVNIISYYINRLARIYPVYFIALAMTMALMVSHHIIEIKAFLLGAVLMQAWVPPYAVSLNSPGWSLSVEVLFYLLFPFLLNYIYQKNHFKRTAIIVIAFWCISQYVYHSLLYSPFITTHIVNNYNFLTFRL
ncbi:acyltransferase family protein [Mucilaginibacter sp. HMF5004]|uniref:acyltransferase family protein n=1 Tax=Mucilaginibacter rivuli TaxID=2857527 RepID=UPI001C5D45C8|nr:acyltransferase family protein [Mucilaginibacter rivuli]